MKHEPSPAAAALNLHELHNATVGLHPTALAAGQLAASGELLPSGLLVPSGTGATLELLNTGTLTHSPEAQTAEQFADPEVWKLMGPERQTKAALLREAIAAGGLNELGVTKESLRVVMIEADGKNTFRLIHTGNGIDIGGLRNDYDKDRSNKAVMSTQNDELFVVTLGDGTTYDLRSGMTSSAYAAKVADAKARGVTLPDSKKLSEETGDDWTWTMLTGEPLTAGGDVQIRHVNVDGSVVSGITDPGDGNRDLRVCPAVEI